MGKKVRTGKKVRMDKRMRARGLVNAPVAAKAKLPDQGRYGEAKGCQT